MNLRPFAAILALGLGLGLMQSCSPGPAEPDPTPTVPPPVSPSPSPEATETPSPTPFQPALTPTFTSEPATAEPPRSTPTFTSTPLPFASGPVVIGTSVAGRPIEAYRFGRGPVERLTVHGIHGGSEFNTIALADRLIAEYGAHPERIPADVTLYIVRNINPDGEARAHGAEGRANDHGVDLNRNWNNRWKPDWNRAGCWNYLPIGAGTYPLSEPEAQSLWRLITGHGFSGMIVVHSMGKIVYPAGQPYEPLSTRMAEALTAVSWYTIPAFGSGGCEYTGQLSDWAASRDLPTVDLELSNHIDTDYDEFIKVMDAFLAWR
jgi:hypothetical protein